MNKEDLKFAKLRYKGWFELYKTNYLCVGYKGRHPYERRDGLDCGGPGTKGKGQVFVDGKSFR